MDPLSVEPRDRSVPWRAREAIPLIALTLVLVVIARVLLEVFLPADRAEAAGLAAYPVILIVVLLGWVRIRHASGLRELGARDGDAGDVLAGSLAAVVGLVVAGAATLGVRDLVERITGREPSLPEQIAFESPTALELALAGLAVVVLAPIAEELLFRGFLYQAMRRWSGVAGATMLSSVVFASAHVFPILFPALFGLGILLALLVEWRGRLLPAIVAHGVFNAVGFSLILLRLAEG